MKCWILSGACLLLAVASGAPLSTKDFLLQDPDQAPVKFPYKVELFETQAQRYPAPNTSPPPPPIPAAMPDPIPIPEFQYDRINRILVTAVPASDLEMAIKNPKAFSKIPLPERKWYAALPDDVKMYLQRMGRDERARAKRAKT